MADDTPKITESWAAFLGNLGASAQGPTQQVYREWERWFGSQVERMVGNPQFLGQVGRALSMTGALKPLVEQAVAAAMRARGPSNDDRVAQLEARVKSLEEALAKLQRGDSA